MKRAHALTPATRAAVVLAPATRAAVALVLAFSALFACAGWSAARAAARGVAPDVVLTDQFGERRAWGALRGRPLVVFFGYTHCGDVCPLTLAKLARAKAQLGASARSLQVVFVTVDPARDTPPVLRRFVALFDPSFIAFTGSNAELARVYAGYHVRHRVVRGGRSARDYDVEHPSFTYFSGPDGRMRGFGDWSDSQVIVTQSVRDLVSAAQPVRPYAAR